MDILRGFALMGILLMNINGFGLPIWTQFVPLGTLHPAFTGPHAHLNAWVWIVRWILGEGKMRALFSMLFGAGVVLLTSRAEERGEGERVADIFLRRNMWLIAIGLLHAYLIWFGDILVWYGMTALLFLYPCRKLKARTLLTAGTLVVLVSSLSPFSGGVALQDFGLSSKAAAAAATQQSGKALTAAQIGDQKAWEGRLAAWKPDAQAIESDLNLTRSGYVGAQMHHASDASTFQSVIYYTLGFGDVLGMMLIGMGLARNGFLSGRLPYKTYASVALAGFLISLPAAAMGAWKACESGFDLITSDKWLFLPYELVRVPGALATAALLLMLVKSGFWPSLMKRVAAVGQTALSNYIFTSILCQFVFVWGPYKLYERLEFYQLFYVVAAVWAVNLIWSSIWLRYFEFGPLEWVWRSLTYWKKQPMRLQSKVARGA
ncbi:DUF418 domain-containing protein [Granulicella mallensis]|nr:DUF418 domain-containing protein [Granulicella mallensis]MBB5064985.1 uncharacterized protein [Granulicella mallensis]